jgi:hypothetical protein
MDVEIGREPLPSSKVSLYKDQSVLFLNQHAAPCTAVKCDLPFYLLQSSSGLKYIQEQNPSDFLDSLSFLKPKAVQNLIESCNEKGNGSVFKHKLEHSMELNSARYRPNPFFRQVI